MTDNDRPLSPPALAFGEPVIVVAPDGVDGAMAGVIGRHAEEFNAALEPFGVTLEDLVRATWMRFVRVADVTPLGSNPDLDAAPWRRYARGELTYDEAVQLGGPLEADVPEGYAPIRIPAPDGVYPTDQLADPEPFGEPMELPAEPPLLPLLGRGCCGVNEACSSKACTGTPVTGGAGPDADRQNAVREAVAEAHEEMRLEEHKVDLRAALRRSAEQAREDAQTSTVEPVARREADRG